MIIDFGLIQNAFPYLMRGAFVTIQIAALSCTIGMILGSILGFCLVSTHTLTRFLATIYSTIFRGTPMLIQILFAAFVLPTLGINIPSYWAVIWAIGLNSAAYISHIIKSGISSVGKGQIEAGKMLGFSHLQIIRYIVFPQAVRVVLPSLGNEFIVLVKDSSLASIVGVMELTKQGEIIISQTYDALSIYIAVALTYLIITTSLTLVVDHIERKMKHA
jgi:polar amino acid transport system permease protein